MMMIQAEHNRHYFDYDSLTDADRDALVKDYVLLGIDEFIELLRCINYKKHRIQRVDLSIDNVTEEIIDVMKYLLSIALVYGVSAEDFSNAFMNKSNVVEQRYIQEQKLLTEETKLICVDLDGVIADWSKGIFEWYSPTTKYETWRCLHSSYDIGVLMNLTKYEAEEAKKKFMVEGNFATLPEMQGAKVGMQGLKKMGYVIAIVTARPYLECKRVYHDTISWLAEHEIPYDFIFWGKDKADIVYKELRPVTPEFFIEDRDKHAIELANERIEVLLLDQPYNSAIQGFPHIHRVNDWEDLIDYITDYKVYGKGV